MLCGVLAIGLLIWEWQNRLIETPIAIVLTHLEVSHSEGVLRYENVTTLTARFLDKKGNQLAEMSGRGGQPVIAPPPVWLPSGDYRVDIDVTLRAPSGAVVRRRLERTVTLDGSMTQLTL